MEISALLAIYITFYSILCAWLYLQSFVHDEISVGSYLLGELGESLKVVLLVAVDVKVIGVGRCDCGNIWFKMQERAVVLVGLNDYKVTLVREYEVALVILGYSAQECSAVHA